MPLAEEGGKGLMFFFFPHMYEKVEGGGGKGVNLGFREMFFSLWGG